MINPKRSQVIVLGMHRSGTSALTGLLSACGLYVGTDDDLTKPGAENPKGFFERRDTRAICDALLHAAGADWWKVSDFTVDDVPPAALQAQGKEIRRVVEFLDAQGAWALKEPRLCMLLPIFRRHLDDPVAAIIHRNPLEVARSLRHRNGFPLAAGLALWEAYTVALLRHSADMPRIFVSYADLLADPEATTEALRADLAAAGVAVLAPDRAGDAIVPSYRHEHADGALFDLLLSEPQKRLWRYVSTREGDAPVLEVSQHSRVLLSEFESDRAEVLRVREQFETRQKEAVEKMRRLTADAERHAEKRETDAQARAQLRDKLTEAEARSKAQERQATEAEKRASRLGESLLKQAAELAASQTQAKAQERQATEAEQRASRLAERVAAQAASEARAKAQERQLAESEQRASRLGESLLKQAAELAASQTQAKAQERQATEAEQRASRLAERVAEQAASDARAKAQERQLAEAEKRASRLGESLSKQTAELAASQTQVKAHERQAATFRAKAEAGEKLAFAYLEHRPRFERKLPQLSAEMRPLLTTLASGTATGAVLVASRATPDSRLRASWTARLLRPLRARIAARRDAALLRRSPLFDAEWYKQRYPDVARAKIDPLRHYLRWGAQEGRDPSPGFSSSWYLSRYEDVRASGLNPLVHYLRHGRSEKRAPLPEAKAPVAVVGHGPGSGEEDVLLLNESEFFDKEWYLRRYGDVARKGVDPVRHYLRNGAAEGRDPGPRFDTSWYLDRYGDVARAGMNPLVHFIRYGRKENRLPSGRDNLGDRLGLLEKQAASASASEPRAAFKRVTLSAPAPAPAPTVRSTVDPARPAADVDVIVPVFNALDDVRKCLSSLRRHHDGFTVRVLVVDDGSDEKTGAFLRATCQSDTIFDLIDLGGNQGYTRAINHGLRASSARYVVTLNSDTIVTTGWLAGMINCAESDPGIGIVGPLSNAASWQNVPQLLDDDGKVFAINPLPADMSADEMARLVAATSACSYPRSPFLNGFCYLIKRGVIDAIGLLDEENFPVGYGEENDYSIRARDAGFDLAIADDAYVFHAKSKSFGHERRTELSKQGSERLKAKHTPARVNALIERVKETRNVDPIRRRVADALAARAVARQAAPNAQTLRVLFLLPARGGGGGVHSIVQEVGEMRRMGVTAHVAIREKDHSDYLQLYRDVLSFRELFIPFGKDDLPEIAAAYDIVVATIFTSVAMLKALVDANPTLVPAYYVQDYEPLFFAQDDPNRAIAELSYELIPGMLVFAKTQWLADTIRGRHGIEARKVAPSLDHEVYRPRPDLKPGDGRVHVAAMIRPRTPRRGAERTMRVLSRLAQTHGDRVAINVFGCRDDDVDFQGLERDFPFRNFGVLTRPEVAEVLAASDVFVDLSDYQAFGRTGLEAMACGCVPMVPVHGGTGEYAVDGVNALVVDSLDEDACFRRLEELMLGGAETLAAVSEAGLKAAAGFSVRQAAQSEVQMLLSVFADTRNTRYTEQASEPA